MYCYAKFQSSLMQSKRLWVRSDDHRWVSFDNKVERQLMERLGNDKMSQMMLVMLESYESDLDTHNLRSHDVYLCSYAANR